MSIFKKKPKYTEGMASYKMSAGDIVFNIINYLVFALLALICVFPFYYLFINTVSSNDLVTAGSITWRPIGFHLNNYKKVLEQKEIIRSFGVTIARTLIGTTLMVLASAFVGYLSTKQEMYGRKFLYRVIIITMYFNAGLIPWFLTLSALGLTNNFWGYIIPGIVAPYNIILVKTYIESIPAELEESAKIDGASYMKIFAHIILPLSKPILATIAIFGAVGHWNSFTDAMILMSGKPELYTLQYELYIYLTAKAGSLQNAAETGDVSSAQIAEAMSTRTTSIAVSMTSILPIVLVYPFMMRYFEKGIMIGAVKG